MSSSQTVNASDSIPGYWKWTALALASAIFFVATGGAFSSLGVLLPSMIAELSLTWTQAGAAFTVLALMTGLSSTLPAVTFKYAGFSTVYFTGGALVAAGFATLGLAQNLVVVLIGAGLVGTGYSQVASVPAVKLLSTIFSKRSSLTIGIFFTCGALGSVAGPQIAQAYVDFTPSWRGYWLMIAGVTFGLCVIAALFMNSRWLRQNPADLDSFEEATPDAEKGDWTLKEAMANPQYIIIVLGVTITLLGALTMNTWQPTHMQNMGVTAAVAANALSAHAIFNALARFCGGAVADRVGAKLLFVSGLAAGVVGMTALSVADTTLLIGLFALGDGYSFGIVTFGSTILLLKYYGPKNNPAILGTLNLITTVAMVGPIVAGSMGERFGGFKEVFAGLAILMLICTIAAALMPTPKRPAEVPDGAPQPA
ncbi:MAG: MFS transporter [Pseudomonadota bacterium]